MIDAPGEMVAELALLGENGMHLNSYQFTLHPGENTYLIRASAGYYWSAGLVRQVEVWMDEGAQMVEMAVLEGD